MVSGDIGDKVAKPVDVHHLAGQLPDFPVTGAEMFNRSSRSILSPIRCNFTPSDIYAASGAKDVPSVKGVAG